MRFASFSNIPTAQPDTILGINEAYQADPNPNKVNMGIGVYKNEQGHVPTLSVVQEAQRRWLQRELSKNYLRADGEPLYTQVVQKLLLGKEHPTMSSGQVVTVQTLGGTGGLKIGADFLRRFFPESGVWISEPSWDNHRTLFEGAGFAVNTYPYYDRNTRQVTFDAMYDRLATLDHNSIVVCQACCHNPTGADLSREQWCEIAVLAAKKGLILFVDIAYQGLGQGLKEDAFVIEAFAEAGASCLIASSLSKTFTLYRERVGALTILTESVGKAQAVLGQVKQVVRVSYSSPPSLGAQVAALVLADQELNLLWQAELASMRRRLTMIREALHQKLEDYGVADDFQYLTRQHGMFSLLELPLTTIRSLRERNSIYMLESGRINVAGLYPANIDYVCQSIARLNRI